MRRISAIAVSLAVAACSTLAPVPTEPPPFKPTPGPIELVTVGSPLPSSAECDSSTLEGTLVQNPVTGLGLHGTEGPVAIVWPSGYRAGASIGAYNLIDPAGNVVAQTGQRVRVQGSGVDEAGRWVACGSIVRLSL